MKIKLNSIFEASILSLSSAKSSLNVKNIESILIDEKFFNSKYFKENVTHCNYVKIGNLKIIKSPVLYWFSFEDKKCLNSDIRGDYTLFRERMKSSVGENKYRNTAALKSSYCNDSNILYVGKVEKSFWGRVVTHLGYNKSERTAGMQLYHWYNTSKYGNLRLDYIVFNYDMKDLMPSIEKKLAKDLKPLVGRY